MMDKIRRTILKTGAAATAMAAAPRVFARGESRSLCGRLEAHCVRPLAHAREALDRYDDGPRLTAARG